MAEVGHGLVHGGVLAGTHPADVGSQMPASHLPARRTPREPLPEYFPLPEDLTLPSWVAFAPAAGNKRVPLTGTLFEYLDRIYGPRSGGRVLCYVKADARKVSDKHINSVRDREYGFCHHFDELRGGRRRPAESQEAEYDRQLIELDLFAGHEFRDGGRPFICFGHMDANPAQCLENLRAALRRDLPNVLGIRLAVTRASQRNSRRMGSATPTSSSAGTSQSSAFSRSSRI